MVLGILLFDIAIFLLLKTILPQLKHTRWRVPFNMGYWIISSLVLACFWFLDLIFMGISSYTNRKMIISWIAIVLVSKILAGVYLVLDECFKAGGTLLQKIQKREDSHQHYYILSSQKYLEKSSYTDLLLC